MISAIVLAGGVGSRFGANTPKQFLMLNGKPVIRHSFELLLSLVNEMIVVCEQEWEPLFPEPGILFARPGIRRQDSVISGAKLATSEFLLIHDGARPFLLQTDVEKVITEGIKTGAATLGTPLSFTVKEVDANGWVVNTPPRASLYEIQTPQVIRRSLFFKGAVSGREVTDDVSFAEIADHPVKIVAGSPSNIKITYAKDLPNAVPNSHPV